MLYKFSEFKGVKMTDLVALNKDLSAVSTQLITNTPASLLIFSKIPKYPVLHST